MTRMPNLNVKLLPEYTYKSKKLRSCNQSLTSQPNGR